MLTDREKKAINALISNPPLLEDFESASAHKLDEVLGCSTEVSKALIRDLVRRKLITRVAEAAKSLFGGTPWRWEIGPGDQRKE